MKDPDASFDYHFCQYILPILHIISQSTYIETASIFRLEFDNRLAAELNLGAVLRPEPRHDLDTVRHDRETYVIQEQSYVGKALLESDVVGVVQIFRRDDKEVDGVVDTGRVIAQFFAYQGAVSGQFGQLNANTLRRWVMLVE